MKSDTDKKKYQILNYQLSVQKVETTFREFAVHKIEPVLIKGLAAAANYPEPSGRTFSDIDLAVDPVCFENALKVADENKLNVDLHRGLRHLDTAGWEDLFNNSEVIEINNTRIRVLRPEDHLRVLCVHWLNDGGADRSRLWDIYFALKRKPEEFDWEKFFGSVDEKRKKWLMTVLWLVRDYFGLKLEGLPSELKNFELPVWVKKEVEREWASDQRLTPLHFVLNDGKQFFRQVLKRLPPNALQAVVENEDEIAIRNTFLLRMKNILKRVKPSLERILKRD